MDKQIIITIGREFGSGGLEIAEKLGAKLGIPVYDKEYFTNLLKQDKILEKDQVLFDESSPMTMPSIKTPSKAATAAAMKPTTELL